MWRRLRRGRPSPAPCCPRRDPWRRRWRGWAVGLRGGGTSSLTGLSRPWRRLSREGMRSWGSSV
uniref:Uncharacterized protein n=1 Tax=Arundo donax TaxID=35708 RepID=A0A0A9G3M7_ARUDO